LPVFRVSPAGQSHGYGSRRNLCYNAPEYVAASERIVRAVASHYGNDERIIGFQVDNESIHDGSDRCECEHCKAAWHRWLAELYGTVDKLNKV